MCPGGRLLDDMAALFLILKGPSVLFSVVTVPISTNSGGGYPFLHTLSSIRSDLLIMVLTLVRCCLTVVLVCISNGAAEHLLRHLLAIGTVFFAETSG